MTIEELLKCADVIVEATKVLSEKLAEDDTEQPKPLDFEQVRGILASKSKDGKTAEVKALIAAFGVDRLSDIKPEQYAELVAQAEVL